MHAMFQDVLLAARRLRRKPGFAVAAVLILALGLGATTALFSVVHAVLLTPLPYPESERIYRVQELDRPTGELEVAVSSPTFRDWRESLSSFSHLGATRFANFNLTGEANPRQIRVARVNEDFLTIFAPSPSVGRVFTQAENSAAPAPVLLLGHSLWQTHFGGRSDIAGAIVHLDGRPHTVVGVMPEGFDQPDWADVWMPLGEVSGTDRKRRSLTVYARLAGDAEPEEAAIELATVSQRLRDEFPETHEAVGATLRPLLEEEVGEVRTTLLILFAAVAGVLLIVCLNVAGLQLARGLERRRELALRSALGAGRRRVVSELLTETLVLAVVGGLGGMLLAQWGFDAILALAPDGIPRIDEAQLNAPVLAFALAATLLAGVVAGWLPALASTRFQLDEVIKRRDGEGRKGPGLRGALVVAQVALTVVMLASAGLLIGSLRQLLAVDSGFDTEGRVSVGLVLPPNLYAEPQQRLAFVEEVVQGLQARPEIARAAVGNSLPWSGIPGQPIGVAGTRAFDNTPTFRGDATEKIVSEGYFETLGIQTVAGRTFERQDRGDLDAPGVEPVVINETLARRVWPDIGRPPVGELLELSAPGREPWTVEVLGVVADVRYFDPAQPAGPQVFRFFDREPWGYFNIAVLSAGPDAATLLPVIRSTIWEVDPERPLFGELSALQSSAMALQQPRFSAVVLGGFAGVALLLAAIGVYGLMAFVVGQRHREIGIRMALGARRHRVRRMVVRQGLGLVGAGLVLGIPAALVASRWLEGLLFGIEPGDPRIFALALVTLLTVGWLAVYLPAARASRIEPVRALREE